MSVLQSDTLYYRWDHPNGFIFSAGNEAPSQADGWRVAPDNLPDGPPVVYECTTLRAFQALLDSERHGAREEAAGLRQALAQARATIATQQNTINGLTAALEALRPEGA